ncbi:hypothetical protein HKX48_005208 [Thoreauomyces humboldtii]|nr:hypothetical protein HKX48_005208 [Thoreauomyces humboldtii]
MHIVSLNLDSLCKFDRTDIPLSELTVLVGTNRSGKTSVLQGIGLLALLMRNTENDGTITAGHGGGSDYIKRMADQVALGNSDYLSRQGDVPVSIGATFSDGSSVKYAFETTRLDSGFVVSCAPAESHKYPPVRYTFFPRDVAYSGQTAKLLGPLSPRGSSTGDEDLDEDAPSLSEKLSERLWDGRHLGRITANVIYFLERKHPKAFAKLGSILKSMFSGIGDILIERQGDRVNFQFSRTETTTTSSWVREGSGVAYVSSVFAAVLFDQVVRFSSIQRLPQAGDPEPVHILALDEPSSPLHPHLVDKFLTELKKLGISQIVLATHSVDLLSHCAKFGSSFVSLDAQPPFAVASLSESMLDTLGIDLEEIRPLLRDRKDDLMLLGARRNLLFVENDGDWTRLQLWMDRINSSRARAFAERVVVQSTSGRKPVYAYCEKLKLTTLVLSELAKVAGDDRAFEPLRVAISVDGDYIPAPVLQHEQKQFRILLKKECGDSVDADSCLWQTWKQVESENYLLDKDLIVRFLESGTIKGKAGGLAPEELWNSVMATELAEVERRFAAESASGASIKGDDNLAKADRFNQSELMPSLMDYMTQRWQEARRAPATIVNAKSALKALGVAPDLYPRIVAEMTNVPNEVQEAVNSLFGWAQV